MTIDATFYEELRKEREWAATDAGKAFHRFENACSRYWQADGGEHVSDRRLKELDETMRQARRELLQLIRGW